MRIPYDSLTLRAVVGELREAIVGGVIHHIAQPVATDLVLSVRTHGATILLLLSCDASTPRAHLTHVKRPNPRTAPAFCMICRKLLEGARVVGVRQQGFDRILVIEVQDREGATHNLIAELMGKHSNLILVREDGRVADSAKRITHRQSRFREVLPGKLYTPPPAPEGRDDPFLARVDELDALGESMPGDLEAGASRLLGRFQGLSPFLASEIALRAERQPLREVWDEIFGAAARGTWSPVVIRNARSQPIGAYPLPTVQVPADAQNARSSIDIALDHYYSVALPLAAAEAARRQLAGEIDHAIAAKRKQAAALNRSLHETTRAEEFKQNGELILANLHRIEPEAESVTVADYYHPDAVERTIPLDAGLSAQDNAETWFRRYRKARDGVERLQETIGRVQDEIGGLERARGRLDEAEGLPAVQALRTELYANHMLRLTGTAGSEKEERRASFEGKKIRSVATPEGWEILVGENSEANDYLTTRVASPNDLWLHVRANASAHVVIRTRNQPGAVPQSVLRQAAELAARHSPAKHSSLVPVDYTLRKYVRKPRGSVPGAALYQNEKTLYVTPAE